MPDAGPALREIPPLTWLSAWSWGVGVTVVTPVFQMRTQTEKNEIICNYDVFVRKCEPRAPIPVPRLLLRCSSVVGAGMVLLVWAAASDTVPIPTYCAVPRVILSL